MSPIGLALRWTGLPQWALELIACGAIVAGLLFYHHHVYVTGIDAQKTADRLASEKVEAQAAAATQAAQDAANRAEESYHAEVTHNAALAAAHPLPAVRLCDDAGSTSLSETGPAHPGNDGDRTPSGGVPQVSEGNPGLRPVEHPDISGLLGLLADRADDGSAVTREFQSREIKP